MSAPTVARRVVLSTGLDNRISTPPSVPINPEGPEGAVSFFKGGPGPFQTWRTCRSSRARISP